MASNGNEEDTAPKRSMSGWKASKPGALPSKEGLLSGGRHRCSTPSMGTMAGRGQRRSPLLTSRPGTMVGGSPRGAGALTQEHDALDDGDIVGTSPLEREDTEERESLGGGMEKSEKVEEVEEEGLDGAAGGDGLDGEEEDGIAETERDVKTTLMAGFDSATHGVSQSDSCEKEREIVVTEMSEREGRDHNEATENDIQTIDDAKETTESELESGGEEKVNTATAKDERESVTSGETQNETTDESQSSLDRSSGGDAKNDDSEGNPYTETEETAISSQAEERECVSVSGRGALKDFHGSEKDSERESTEEVTVAPGEIESQLTKRLRKIEQRASASGIPLRPLEALKQREKRPFSDGVALAKKEGWASAARRGTEISAVAPSPRSFCSSSQQKIIINSTGQKREHSLKSATVLGQRDGRGESIEALGSILRRSTVSQADPFPFSAPLPSALGTKGDATDDMDVPYRKGRSGTVAVSPVDYHQSQQQFWFAGGDYVSSSPDSPAIAPQSPKSRLRNETFVMPIVCSSGAIPTSDLLTNPMIPELRTQFAEAHGLTDVHTLHVYEAFHFMKQLTEVGTWLAAVLEDRAPALAQLAEGLEDGTLLCALANKVKSGAADAVALGSDSSSGAVEFGKIENVARFLAACEHLFGLDRQDLFCEADVVEKKSIIMVVHGLHVLAKKAHSLNEELPELAEIEEGAREAYEAEVVRMAAAYVATELRHHMAPLQQT